VIRRVEGMRLTDVEVKVPLRMQKPLIKAAHACSIDVGVKVPADTRSIFDVTA
jgi:hypothetical protein